MTIRNNKIRDSIRLLKSGRQIAMPSDHTNRIEVRHGMGCGNGRAPSTVVQITRNPCGPRKRLPSLEVSASRPSHDGRNSRPLVTRERHRQPARHGSYATANQCLAHFPDTARLARRPQAKDRRRASLYLKAEVA